MADDELERLSREALLELVRRQQDALAEHDAAIERHDEKIRELEDELLAFRRPAKRPENSSVPPSRGQKANRVDGRHRKLGPKWGHVGVSRVRSEPDVIVACRPTTCDGRGGPLPQTGGRRVGRSHSLPWGRCAARISTASTSSATRDPHGVVELPSFRPVVIEGWQYAMTCADCGVQTTGTYPAGLEPRRTFGPGVEALLGYFHERHHVGYERLVGVCRDVFGLAISQGGIVNALQRLVERARPTYAAIGATVRGSAVINSDETSARVAGRTQWQWTFQTPEASYHVIELRRGGEVIEAFLAGVEPEVWCSGFWVLTPAGEHQLCMSQQERNLTFAVEADTGESRLWANEARLWANELRHVFGRAIRRHHERGRVTPETFARRRLLIENATDRLVFDRAACPERSEWVTPKTEAARLRKRYRLPRDRLYVFLDSAACPECSERVEPTNNSSERDLLPSFIHRKVIGGFRSTWGAEASASRSSMLTTARKQGRNLLDAVRVVAGPSPLQAFSTPT